MEAKQLHTAPRRGRHRTAFRHRRLSDDIVRAVFASATPLRCPREMVRAGLRRVNGISSPEGREALRQGESFVSVADGLTGGEHSPLLKWDLPYLQRYLPKDMDFPVLHRGTGKIIMTHSNRYMTTAQAQQALDAGATLANSTKSEQRFAPVRRVMMSFDDFVSATDAHRSAHARGEADCGDPPYFGSDLLWRTSMADNGSIQNIGEQLKRDLLQGANFSCLKRLQADGDLPPWKQVHLFVGSERTLYHCHYDLQPNLHVQLVGRKRFILFPPEETSKLYPFPVHHEYDRRSQVDLDNVDEGLHPGCTSAKGVVVELQPNELLYIPPGWWHHVQTCTTPCVSMAWWFYERLTASDEHDLNGFDESPVGTGTFGLNTRARQLILSRWLEECIGRLIEPIAEERGELLGDTQQAKQRGAMWAGPRTEAAVAKWLLCLGMRAAARLAGSGRREDARGLLPEDVTATVDELQVALPPLQEGIGIEMLEEMVSERAALEIGTEGAVDGWMVRALRWRGLDRPP